MFTSLKEKIKNTKFIDTLLTRFKPHNFEFNKFYWDTYAALWDKKLFSVENNEVKTRKEQEEYIKCLGDEWGKTSDTKEIIEEYIYPYISRESKVCEIGSGGGRIALNVAPIVKELHCFDISKEMLTLLKKVLSKYKNVNYLLLKKPQFPHDLENKFDFVYSFDVFVHLDLHMIWKYLKEINRILKTGGKAFLHTTNLKAPGGWEKFVNQEQYSPRYHYFIVPEIIHTMLSHLKLELIKESKWNEHNFYFNRDYLFVVNKKGN